MMKLLKWIRLIPEIVQLIIELIELLENNSIITSSKRRELTKLKNKIKED